MNKKTVLFNSSYTRNSRMDVVTKNSINETTFNKRFVLVNCVNNDSDVLNFLLYNSLLELNNGHELSTKGKYINCTIIVQ